MKKQLFGVLFFVLMILLVELLLGMFHLERADHLFAQRSSFPFFIPGTGAHADDYVTNPHFSYQLNLQSFPRQKKAGVKRIFILGSSAAYGWPYTEEYGFSGYLRRALNNGAPNTYEIIDAAGMSFGSHRALDELRDIVTYDPDLIIINSGNNEYIEKNILPPTFGQENRLEQLSGVLAKTNTYRAVRLGLLQLFPKHFQRPLAPDMTDIRSTRVVRRAGMIRTTTTEQEVLANYQKNISAMQELLGKMKIKGIFTTVPNNITTWLPANDPPVISLRQDLIKWKNLQDKIIKGFAAGNHGELAIVIELERLLNESLKICPDYALNWYNLGQVEMALGQRDAAYNAFLKARDLDHKPVRALSSFNESIRTLVKNDRRFELLDLEKIVGSVIRSGQMEGMFLDYCHYTQEGHKFIAIAMLPAIQEALDLHLPLPELEQLIHTDNHSPVNDRRLMAMELYARGMTYINNERYEEAKNAFARVLEIFPFDDPVFKSGMMDNLASAYSSLGLEKEAKKYYQMSLESDPDNTVALVEVGNYLLDEGKLEEAGKLFNHLLKVNAYSPGAMEGLGRIAQRQGKIRESLALYEESLKLGGGNTEVYKDLSKAYYALGDSARGKDFLLKARESDPLNIEN